MRQAFTNDPDDPFLPVRRHPVDLANEIQQRAGWCDPMGQLLMGDTGPHSIDLDDLGGSMMHLALDIERLVAEIGEWFAAEKAGAR